MESLNQEEACASWDEAGGSGPGPGNNKAGNYWAVHACRCSCGRQDKCCAGRTVGVGKPIQFLLVSDTRCGPFRGCMALPILYCILPSHIPTAQQTETLLIPDDETVELAPLRRFRKHATMCRSKRRGTEARPACMYCARVDRAFRSAQLCRCRDNGMRDHRPWAGTMGAMPRFHTIEQPFGLPLRDKILQNL